jgi:hypothetical protein
MANLWYLLNDVKLFPALPVERTVELIEEVLPMAAGNERSYYRGALVQWTLTHPVADEAEHAEWLSAAVRGTALPLVEPDGTTATVRVTGWDDPIVETAPTSGAGTSTATGTITRSITLTLRGRVAS